MNIEDKHTNNFDSKKEDEEEEKEEQEELKHEETQVPLDDANDLEDAKTPIIATP